MSPRDGTFDVLAFGDVHRHYALVRRACRRERERAPYALVLTVGDFSDSTKHTEPEDPEDLRDLPLVRCHGNHEDWAHLERLPGVYVKDGEVVTTAGLRVLAFGGVHVPRLWEVDPRTLRDHERKAMTRREHESALGRQKIDVLLTHEAGAYLPNPHNEDEGQRRIAELVERVRPRLHLMGHHHHFTVCRHGATVGMMLPIPTSAWARIHYEAGRPVAYTLARLEDKHFDVIAERLAFPDDGRARVGLPGSHTYEEVGVYTRVQKASRRHA